MRTGPAEFGLVVEGPIVFLLYKFGAIPWSDAPYSWHMTAKTGQQTLPSDIPEGMGALLTKILVDASDGIIRGIRAIGLGTEFSRQLHAAIIDQSVQAFDQDRYDAALHDVYQRYQTSDALLARAIARYRTGDPDPSSGKVPRGTPR